MCDFCKGGFLWPGVGYRDCSIKRTRKPIVWESLKVKLPFFCGLLKELWKVILIPYLNYGILIWGNTCKTFLDKIINLLKWTVRIISNSHYRSHTKPLFARHNLLNIEDIYSLELGVFMYKFSINKLPYTFHNYFSRRFDIYDYQTGHKNDLAWQRIRKYFQTTPLAAISLELSIKHFRKQYKHKLVCPNMTNVFTSTVLSLVLSIRHDLWFFFFFSQFVV